LRLAVAAALCPALPAFGVAAEGRQAAGRSFAAAVEGDAFERVASFNFAAIRSAIEDLAITWDEQYPDGPRLLAEVSALEQMARQAEAASATGVPWPEKRLLDLAGQLDGLKRRALLANPGLKDLEILCVKRAWKDGVTPDSLIKLGIPSNHECQSSLPSLGYDNEIAVFQAAAPAATWRTVCRPDDTGFVGNADLHWNADRLLFAKADAVQWKLWEMRLDGSGLRQITHAPEDVDCFEPCYLPNGRILSASNATGQCVPCWHGVARKYVANLFVMNADGSGMRRVTFDQDHDIDPAVLASGQVVYNRWDYTGINRVFLRPLMVMNPDGTAQRSLYGSNSWFPNGLYSMHELPGRPGQLLSILSGYHGPGRTGHLVIVDTNRGRKEADGIVSRISGRGLPLEIEYMDRLTEGTWPKFYSSCPITDKQFLVSGWMSEQSRSMGIYLADAFDNLLLLYEVDKAALLEPIPVVRRPTPPSIPEQTDPGRDDAVVYLQDVHVGPGLDGVPRGTVKRLRVIAYHFGYVGLAGNDKIGLSGPWEAMRILGTTPVAEDGSALFRIPANTPVAFQALDGEGKAVQLMRTWLSARPGERVSCVGCHESPGTAPPAGPSMAAGLPPREFDPWHGPARGFDFAREVQPVLNKHCVSCHDGRQGLCDLRAEDLVDDYEGRLPGRLDLQRMWKEHRLLDGGRVRYTPAYEAMVPYIRRVNVGDDVSMLTPGYYHADTSELVQMLQKGHQGVVLDREAWDRLVTWIDLNGPCHGTWSDVFEIPIPQRADARRLELFQLYGGPPDDPEQIPPAARYDETPREPTALAKAEPVALSGWPFDAAAKREAMGGTAAGHLDLGDGVRLAIVKIPAGRFVMGDVNGEPDEGPLAAVEIEQPFWMGVSEVSNRQLRRCLPSHDSGTYTKRHEDRYDDKGMPLCEPSQPALKVSWNEAMEFCRWLSRRTGLDVSLPTEAQWEYACRAGSDAPFHYGGFEDDFGPFENVADRTFATFGFTGKSLTGKFEIEGGIDYLVPEGVDGADRRFDDGECMTAPIRGRRPNSFGLSDMHGNVAEWTLSVYRPYPYDAADGRNAIDASGERVVRGGSFLDRPARCRSSARYSYPAWQKVYNVGFRVVINQPVLTGSGAK
jgi:formylglycine-generating enzyme required for sulfatase activity